MKKLFTAVFIFAAAIIQAASAPASVKGKVNVADFLNVRLGPGLKHPVMGRLLPGQEVEIVRIHNNWLEIKAPQTLKIYVSEARVDVEGKLHGELNMRCRMDSKSPSFGLLPAGTVVKRTEERSNGWLRILPPDTLTVYTTALCVTFDRKQFNANGLPVAAPAAVTPAVPADQAVTAQQDAAKEPEKTVNAAADEPEKNVKPAGVTLSGVPYKWKYASSKATSIAFLDKAEGRNQTFVCGATEMLQQELIKHADAGNRITVTGVYDQESKAVSLFTVFEIKPAK